MGGCKTDHIVFVQKQKEMKYIIDLHPLAQQEMQESYEWYEERLEGLGKKFLTAIQKRLVIISQTPELYGKKKANYREVSVEGYPFKIVYNVFEKQKTVFVTAVFHMNRNPKTKYNR